MLLSFPGSRWPRRHLPWEFISHASTHVNLRFDFSQQKDCHWKWSKAANQYESLSESIEGRVKGHMGYLGYKEFLLTCSADLYAIPHLCRALSHVLSICLWTREMSLSVYMQQKQQLGRRENRKQMGRCTGWMLHSWESCLNRRSEQTLS